MPADFLPSQGAALESAIGGTVLLIEDSVHFQNLVKLLLNQEFPDVALHVAGDGIVGLAMAGQLQPDVLIIDILLPSIDRGHPDHHLALSPAIQKQSVDRADLS